MLPHQWGSWRVWCRRVVEFNNGDCETWLENLVKNNPMMVLKGFVGSITGGDMDIAISTWICTGSNVLPINMKEKMITRVLKSYKYFQFQYSFMTHTTPIHENCGTCTECARNPQIIHYKCKKGGSYKLLTGYVGSFDDICKQQTNICLPNLITSIVVGQIVGFFTMYVTNNPPICAVICLGVSLISYLCNEH